jgi:hypothetical protein
MWTWQFRHVVGWVIVLGVISISVFDRTTSAAHGDVEMFVWLVWVIVAVIASAIVCLMRDQALLRGASPNSLDDSASWHSPLRLGGPAARAIG